MKVINRYLAKEVYSAIVVVIVVLLAIFLSNLFVRYMHSLSFGGLSDQGVLILLLLQIPIMSAALLPASLFIAILLAYGRLYSDSEMTVLISCGVSPLRLLTNTLWFSSIIIIIVAILSLWVNPKIYEYSDKVFSGSSAITNLKMIKPNSFTPVAKEKWIFYIDSDLDNKKEVSRVFASEQTGVNNDLHTVMSKSAYQKIDQQTGAIYLVFTDGYRYVGTPGKKDYEIIKYDEYAVRIQQEETSVNKDFSSISTINLWQKNQDTYSSAELQWRISLPLSALILAILATPISRTKPRQSRYARLIPAVILYIVYVNFLFLTRTWIRSGVLKPTLGMWWVHAIVLIIAAFLIYQQTGMGKKKKE